MKSGDRFSIILRVLLIVSGLMTLISVGFLPMLYHRDHSRAWPTTTGVIRAAALKTAFAKPNMAPWFSPFVCYSYRVDGADYTADTWKGRMRYSSGSPKYAEGVVARYPAGQTVTVHYDPTDPGMGILELGNHDGAGVALTVGIVFGLVGALFLWAMTQAEWVQAV